MKIITIEGDNTSESYARLRKLINAAKERGWLVKKYQKNSGELSEFLVTRDLFAKDALFVIDDVRLLKKHHLKWFKNNADNLDATLVIYQAGYIKKNLIKQFPKIDKKEEYKLPKLIWKFLDSVYPGNSKESLTLYKKTIQKEAPEFVFALLVNQVKDLFWAKHAKRLPYPSWRAGKLKRQSEKFTEKNMKEMINGLSEIDLKVKTSKANVEESLDFLLATKLE